MYHLGLLIVVFWIMLSHDPNISNIPLGQLTLSMIADKVLSIGKVFLALWLLYKSLQHDKVWPWRWDKFFVADWLIAITVFSVAIWIGLGAKKNQDVMMLVCIALGVVGYAYCLYRAGFQNEAKEWVLNSTTYDRVRLPDGFDDSDAKTCIRIYVDEVFERTGLPPEGICSVDSGMGWRFDVNFPKPKFFQTLREWVAPGTSRRTT